MMDWMNYWLGLGLEPKQLTFLHVSLRVIVVFLCALVTVRIADRRFLAKMSAVDAVLGFILASMLARAVNGSAPFFPTLGGGVVLVLLHKLCVAVAFRSEKFGDIVKGREQLIIKNGEVQEKSMRAHHITKKDLIEELRQEGQVSSPAKVQTAFVERSGRISVIPTDDD